MVSYESACMYYVLSSPFFTRCPDRHGPSVMIKLPVVSWASTLLMISIYIRTLIIQTPTCHFNVKGVQTREFVQISELSGKIHYLAS